MRRTILLVATMILTLLVASGVALATAIGSAQAANKVVGPGESIQKAVNAADPGDTIVVRGVHREDVVIRENGIKLRGEDAVIEAPTTAKADSPCSKTFGPEGICIVGDVNLDTLKVKERVKGVSVSGFTFRGFEDKEQGLFAIELFGARNATVVGNRAIGNVAGGIIAGENINTTIAKNDVIGNPDTNTEGIVVQDNSRNTTVVKNDVRNIPEDLAAILVRESIDTTVAGNDLISNGVGVFVEQNSTGTKILSNDITDSTFVGTLFFDSTGTKILSNDISRSGDTGIAIFGPERANNDAKVVGNNISGSAEGIFVEGAHGGSFAGNTIHNNCAGMIFEALPSTPGGEFEVKGNTVVNNTRSCRAAQFGTNFSGIGIALLGARDMELTGNQISGNVPSGPTRFSGGVVVSTDPYGPGMTKPTNNSVIGNHFGRNKPDIFWDESGSGNRFLGNLCDTSVPSSLCN
jgi:parallel beta-helix repeat protein